MQNIPSFLQGVRPMNYDTKAEANKPLFQPSPTESKIQSIAKSNIKQTAPEQRTISQDDLFRKVDEAVAQYNMKPEEAMKELLSDAKNKGYTIPGVDIDTELQGLAPQEAPKEDKNRTFLSRLEEAGRKRLAQEGEIETSGRNAFRKLLDKTAVKAGSFSDIIGSLVGEGFETSGQVLSAITPDSIEDRVKNRVIEDFNMVKESVVGQTVGTIGKGLAYTAKEVYDLLPENTQKDIESLGTIGLGILDAVGAGYGVKTAGKLAPQVAETAVDATGKAIKGITYIPKEATIQVLGKTTGAGSEAIRNAFAKGGTESFGKALRGEISDIDLLESAKRGLNTIKDQRKAIYGGENYQKLISNKTPLGVDDVQQSFIDSLEDLKVKVVPTEEGFSLDFSKSKIAQANSENKIRQMFDDVMYWDDDTAEGLDILKQRLQDMYTGGEGTAQADRLSTIMSNSVKSKIEKAVPEYAEMTKAYQNITNEIKEIEKILALGDKSSRMTAITRLNQSMRDNLSMRKEVVEKLEELAGIDLKAGLSGAALRDIMPKGLTGAVYGGGIGYGLASGLFTPTIIAGLLASSPRLIGQVARTIGVTVETLKKGLNNAKTILEKATKGVQSQINEQALKGKEALGDAFDTLADKTGARAKIVSGEGTGISGKVNAPKELIEEAKKYKSAEEFVKAQGNPVYHGSNRKGNDFDIKKAKTDGDSGVGIYFSTDKEPYYGNNFTEGYLDIRNPLYVGENATNLAPRIKDINKNNLEKLGFSNKDINDIEFYKTLEHIDFLKLKRIFGDNEKARKLVESMGYDGIIDTSMIGRFRTEVPKKGAKHYIVFSPTQIKTESQLKEIWKQANKGTGISGKIDDFSKVGTTESAVFTKNNGVYRQKINDVIKSDDLLKKYPEIKNGNIYLQNNNGSAFEKGTARKDTFAIYVGKDGWDNVIDTKKASQIQKKMDDLVNSGRPDSEIETQYLKLEKELEKVESEFIGRELNETGRKIINHELQHVKQELNGYNFNKQEGLSFDEYYNLPEEVEARNAELKYIW